jgi:Na+/H+-dicarboxylate symporter
MIEWKWVLVGVAIGAGVGYFMGQKATGGQAQVFSMPGGNRIDRGA